MQQVFVGIDPSRKGHHAYVVLDENKQEVLRMKVDGSQALIHDLKDLAANCPTKMHVGLEHINGTLLGQIHQAIGSDAILYNLNAARVHQYRAAHPNPKHKDDLSDADCCACYLIDWHARLRPYRAPTPLETQARDLTRQLSSIRTQKTKAWQRFWDNADAIDPSLKPLAGDVTQCTWFVLVMAQVFGKLKHMGSRAFIAACRSRGARRSDDQLLALFKTLKPMEKIMPFPGRLSLTATTIHNLQAECEIIVEQSRVVLADWGPAPDLYRIKGMGVKYLIALLAYHGQNWGLHTPKTMAAYAGTAPKMFSSGTPSASHMDRLSPKQRRRYQPKRVVRSACSKELRWVWTWFAFSSLSHHAWAREAYDRSRERGQGHYEALRNLANKWIRVIYAVVRDGSAYDDHFHAQRIRHRTDPLMQKHA